MSLGPLSPQGSLMNNPGLLQALYPGIDLKALAQLQQEEQLALEAPVQALSSQISQLQKVSSMWQSIQAAVNTLQADAQNVASAAAWASPSASTSLNTVVTATAGTGAQAGSYTVNVTTAGTYDQWLGQAESSSSAALGLSGTFTVNGTSIAVSSSDSLAAIAQKITGANAGASAQVLTSTSGGTTSYHLALTSSNYSELTLTDPNGILFGTGASGLGMTESQKGQAWAYTVNGVATTSSSGQDATTVPGLTLTLAGAGSATVTVTTSSAQAQQGLAQFTSDYNALQAVLAKATGKGDILQGDPTAEGIMQQVNQILLSDNPGAPVGYQSAADAGLTLNLQSDNSTQLAFNTATFAAAQSHPQSLQAIFTGSSGIMTRLSTLLQNLGQAGTGIIPGVMTGIQTQITDLTSRESQVQDLVNLQQAALQDQFNQEMRALMAVSAQKSSLTNLFNSLFFSSSSGSSTTSPTGG